MIHSVCSRLGLLSMLGGLLCCAVLAACDPADTIRSPGRNWQIDSEPYIVLGSSEGEQGNTFHRIVAAFRHDNGDVYVADRGSNELRAFAPSGALRFRVGGPGGGPARFSALTAAGRYVGDTIYAYDGLARRVSLWTPHGQYVRDLTIEGNSNAPAAGALASGEFALLFNEPAAFPRAPGARSMDSLRAVVFDPGGGNGRPLPAIPFRHQYVPHTAGSQRTLITLVPFDPEGIGTVGQRYVYLGWPAEWKVYRIDGATGQTDELRLERELRALGTDIVERRIALREAQVSVEQRPQFRRYWQSFPYRPTLPAYDRLVEDDDQNLWVREYRVLDDSSTTWLVVSPQQRVTAEVILPGAFEPRHIGRDFIVGVLRAALDQEQVAVFALHR